jgi:predicted helicase
MNITQTALEIILKSNSWETFVGELAKLGSNPEFKKLKGEAFEQLTKFYLETDPIFKSMFSEIWHHSDIPINVLDNLKLPSPEIGVDLVAQQTDGSFCAIQCKFHQDETHNVSYDELSTFFSITERKETYEKLSHRLVCTSANEITKKVSKLHPEKLGFICANDFQNLDEIEFRKIHRLIDGKPQKLRPFTPRAHQIQAIRKGREYFVGQHKNRGKIIHPCGSGKSLTAYWLARELMSQTVLVAVPSLALVKQTLNAWTREALADETSMEWMAVCSDQDVSSNDDPAFKTYDLGIAVTTDPTKVSKFLQQPSKSLKVIITTYQSSNVISDAVKEAKHQFDLGIFDEAHKTAGHKSKKFSQLLDDNNVPIHKKVFMTATERQFRGDTTDFLSMDDQLAYGEIIDQLSFREALEQDPPILCDYKVITVTVLRSEIERIISGNKFTKINGSNYSFEEDASTIAALI